MSMLRTSMVPRGSCEDSQKYGWYFAECHCIQPEPHVLLRGGVCGFVCDFELTLVRGSGSFEVGSGVLAASLEGSLQDSLMRALFLLGFEVGSGVLAASLEGSLQN